MRNGSQLVGVEPSIRRRQRPEAGEGAKTALAALANRFVMFRMEHTRGARVPAELREAVLAVLRSGIAPAEVYRSCGVSWSQVIAWEASATRRGAGLKTPTVDPSRVRVFSVVDDDPVPKASNSRPEFELRLGPWSVSVRLDDPGSAEGA